MNALYYYFTSMIKALPPESLQKERIISQMEKLLEKIPSYSYS